MRRSRWFSAAARDPWGALAFASSYFQRKMRARLVRTRWPYGITDSVLKRRISGKLALRKILDPEIFNTDDASVLRALDHEFTILGKTARFPERVNWLADFEGGEWPNLLSPEYEKLLGNGFSLPEYCRHGDIKRTWDLNKHHHLVDLAVAYRKTQNPRYRTELTDQFLDWNHRYPYMHGIGWQRALIVAQRAINWIVCYNLDAFPDPLANALASSLFYHGKYLTENLERSYTGNNNNHLIGDLTALHLIGLSLQKPDWTENSLRMLLTEVKRQVYEDGVDYEQSSGYHRYVLEFLTLVWYANGKQPSFLTETISKMSCFLNDIAWSDGSLPFLSDWDGARVWIRDHHRPAELYHLGRKSPASVAYRDGGYYVLKGGPFHVVFDCGPIGMGGKELRTHGHSDLLSFTLAVDGEPFIIDPGTGTYTENKEIRNWFRSTCAHNAITVDGADQCGLDGTWGIKRHPNLRLTRWETSDNLDVVCGEHDGYYPVIHQREIQLDKRTRPVLRILDGLRGEGAPNYQCYLHIAPDISCDVSDRGVVLTSSRSSVMMHFDGRLTPRKAQGWYAPDYGRWIEATMLVFEGKSCLPEKIIWEYVKLSQ